MPVAVPLVGLAASVATSAIQSSQAKKAQQAAQKNINDYQRQDLVNPANGLQVSTLGADRQREDLARTMATYANLASMGGTRGITALAPNLISQQNAQEAQIAANLDEQQARIDQIRANAQLGVMNMQEQREYNDLAGLGTQLDLANARAAESKNAVSSSLINGAANILSNGFESMAQGNGFFGRAGWGLMPAKVPGVSNVPIINGNTINYPQIYPQTPKLF